jgi:hypothetical protein
MSDNQTFTEDELKQLRAILAQCIERCVKRNEIVWLVRENYDELYNQWEEAGCPSGN